MSNNEKTINSEETNESFNEDKKKRKKSTFDNFATFIIKLKRSITKLKMSKSLVSLIDFLIKHQCSEIIKICEELLIRTRKQTITYRDISTAVKLHFSHHVDENFKNTLCGHLLDAGKASVVCYNNYVNSTQGEKRMSLSEMKKSANIILPLSRVRTLITQSFIKNNACRISDSAVVYLTKVLQMLITYMINLSIERIEEFNKPTMITVPIINYTIRGDKYLSCIFSDISLVGGGVMLTTHIK